MSEYWSRILRPEDAPEPEGEAVRPEDAALLRAAFPVPMPSRELRIRVAAACRQAAARPAGSGGAWQARGGPRAAVRWEWAVVLVAGLLLASQVMAPKRQLATASADASSTPGQLSIVDRAGRVAGLCPLRHTSVSASIAGYAARVTVTQEFDNPTHDPVEALYTFPLPDDAAVDEMTMTVGSRVIRGEIRRREEARQIYEAARNAGQAAALLDQERPNIFSQSVANIMPGEKVTIAIGYVNLLKYIDGEYEFSFPMVVGPRYTPGGGYTVPGQRGEPSPSAGTSGGGDERRGGGAGSPTAVVRDAEKITPPITPPAMRAGHDISLTVRLDAGLPVREVRSVLHRITAVAEGERRRTIRLRDDATLPNRDFILRYSVAGREIESSLLAEPAEGGSGYFSLIVQPPAAPGGGEVLPKEILFVIDQSGSQAGWPIQKAKETMRYCIQNMNPGDTFQLLGFNTDLDPCFPAPVHNTPANVSRALRFLDPIEGAGGTDILKAVDYALRLPDDPGRQRVVCYMTDGYVGNDMQILDYVRKHRGRARMYPFGIGNSVNRFLIEGMAKEGGGIAEYVTLNQPGSEAAARFYRRMARSLLTGVRVDWKGLPVEDVYPQQVPDLFVAGRPLVLKGRYRRGAEGEIVIQGTMGGAPWSRAIHVRFPAAGGRERSLSTLWAREKIEDLQSHDWMGAQTGQPDARIREQITNLALEYRLMSQYTSFVAVEQRVVNIGGKQRRIDVPVEMPEGVSYEGVFGEQATDGIGVDTLVSGVDGRHMSRYVGAASAPSSGRAAGQGTAYPLQDSFDARLLTSPMAGGGSPTRSPGELPPPAEFQRLAGVLPPAQARQQAGAAPTGAARHPIPTGSYLAKKPAAAFSDGHVKLEGDNGLRQAEQSGRQRSQDLVQRRALAAGKLAPALVEMAQQVLIQRAVRSQQAGAGGKRIEVQVWLGSLPAGGLEKLTTLGFELAATLTPGRLLLGTVPVARLEQLAALEFVRWVEPPAYR